jgi:hypothetical protein
MYSLLASLKDFGPSLTLIISLSMIASSCSENEGAQIPHTEVIIPGEASWNDIGTVVRKGAPGAWDLRLEGAISPGAMVEKNGTYFLYYIGADGDRKFDGGPRHRAVGVATSRDGLTFAKHPLNPIITFLPHNNEEEGVFSLAAMIDGDGTVMLFYGAMDAGTAMSTSVSGDVRLALSDDGIRFRDVGIVLSHSDRSVWGHGDELFPVGSFRFESTYYVYYIAKGRGAYWNLGLAWGTDRERLKGTKAVIKSGDWIVGGGDVVPLDDKVLALFLFRVGDRDWKHRYIDIRKASMQSPAHLSSRIGTYEGLAHRLVYFDKETGKWFMYYYNRDSDIGGRWAGGN